MKTGTTLNGLRFLLAPEDSSQSPSGASRQNEKIGWDRTKSFLWLVFSILAALLIGQF